MFQAGDGQSFLGGTWHLHTGTGKVPPMAPLSTPGLRPLHGGPKGWKHPHSCRPGAQPGPPGYKQPPGPPRLQIRSCCVRRNDFVCGYSPLRPQSGPWPPGCSRPLRVRPRHCTCCLWSQVLGYQKEGSQWGPSPPGARGHKEPTGRGHSYWKGREAHMFVQPRGGRPVCPAPPDVPGWMSVGSSPTTAEGLVGTLVLLAVQCRARPRASDPSLRCSLLSRRAAPGVLLSGPADLRGVPQATLTGVGPRWEWPTVLPSSRTTWRTCTVRLASFSF